jgi:hypothetical protein
MGYIDVCNIHSLARFRVAHRAIILFITMGADNNRIVTKESAADLAVGASYLLLGLSSILFFVYLFIPLFGGKLSLRALAVYATWAGSALLIRSVARKQQKGIRVPKEEFILLSIYGVFCGIVWFSFPYSVFFGAMMIIAPVVSYKAQSRRMAKEEKKDDS